MLSFAQYLFHLVFPSLCLSCRQFEPLAKRQFCLNCLETLPFTANHKDSFAALEGKEFFPDSIKYFNSLFYYTKDSLVAEMIHRIKYNGQFRIARHLGRKLGEQLKKDQAWNDYIIVPVPIHKKRKKSRGFNQAYEIALGIHDLLQDVPIREYLVRSAYESSQTEKDKFDRSSVLNKSFKIKEGLPKGLRIMLVDDVITTGSTISACVHELANTNPKEIVVVSLGVSI